MDDGTEPLLSFASAYEGLIRDTEPMPPIERDPNGTYMLYTGGTTGMPKGVMYNVGDFCTTFLSMGAMGRGLTPPTTLEEYAGLLASIEQPPSVCPPAH